MIAQEFANAAEKLRCDHSHPVQPPHGTLWNPGPCTKCGARYGSEPIPDALAEPLALLMDDAAECVKATNGVIDTSEVENLLTIARLVNEGAP